MLQVTQPVATELTGCLQIGWSLSPLGAKLLVWALGLFALPGQQDQGGLFFFFLFLFLIAAAMNSELLLPRPLEGGELG